MPPRYLRVVLSRGEDLPSADSNGLSDPYAVLTLGKRSLKSKVVLRTLNPDWAEEFVFDFHPSETVLTIEIFDKDLMSSDFLGRGEVNVGNAKSGELEHAVLVLGNDKKPGPRGKVFVSFAGSDEEKTGGSHASGLGLGTMLRGGMSMATKVLKVATQFNPNGGKGVQRLITVDVVSARGVPSMDANGFADPYCKVRVGKKRRSTRVALRTLAPEWRESFDFVLFDMGGRDSSMCRIDLYDQDFIGSDDIIGHVDIDLQLLPLNVTDERFWPVTRAGETNMFGFSKGKPTPEQVSEREKECPCEVLLLITVADLFSPVLPDDQIAAAQKQSVAWLRIHVIRAENLGAFDADGKSDPFVTIHIGSRKMRTPTINKNLNPQWDCVLEMPVKDVFQECSIQVFDEDDNGKYQNMGNLIVPLLLMKNGVSEWFQLKDTALTGEAQGQILLAFHLTYEIIPAFAKCVARRPANPMRRPDKFDFKVLKAHMARLRFFGDQGVNGGQLLFKAMTWQLTEVATVGFLVGWSLFWLYIQIWHIPFAIGLAVMLIGMGKYARGKPKHHAVFEADAYTEEGEEQDDEEEGGEEVEDEPKKKSSRMGLRTQLRQMRVLAQSLQNVLGEVASNVERVSNLFNWASPVLSAIFVVMMFAITLILLLVPIRYLVMLWGWNKVARTGLRKYHPAFKRSKYFRPIVEAVEFLGRIPDDLQIEQRKRLPLPKHLHEIAESKYDTDRKKKQ